MRSPAKLSVALLCWCSIVAPIRAGAASDIFLRLDSVKGDSMDNYHKGEIDVLSVSGGVSINDRGPSFAPIQLQIPVSRASPVLEIAVPTGRRFTQALVTVRRAGGYRPIEYVKYWLQDVTVISVTRTMAGNEELGKEWVSLSYSRITMIYTPQKADGTPDVPIQVCWDVKSNAPCL